MGAKTLTNYRSFKKLTDSAMKPERATALSAGYDFFADEEKIITPGESKLVKTGIAAYMHDDEVLYLFCRSGSALKANVTLQNAVGVVDSDYYPNEIGFIIRNEGEKNLYIWKGDKIGQGVLMKYLIVHDDDPDGGTRKGGFGSTDEDS